MIVLTAFGLVSEACTTLPQAGFAASSPPQVLDAPCRAPLRPTYGLAKLEPGVADAYSVTVALNQHYEGTLLAMTQNPMNTRKIGLNRLLATNGWSSWQSIGANDQLFSSQSSTNIYVDNHNTTTLLYMGSDSPPGIYALRINASDSPASTPVKLNDTSDGASDYMRQVSLATHPSGALAAYWVYGLSVYVARYVSPSGWQPAERVVMVPANRTVEIAAASINASGQVLIVWVSHIPFEGDPVYASLRNTDGSWTQPAQISKGYASSPQVALNDEGVAYVAWDATTMSGDFSLRGPHFSLYQPTAVQLPSEGNWIGVQPIKDTQVYRWQMLLDTNGNARFIWDQDAPNSNTVYSRLFDHQTGKLSDPVPVSTTEIGATNPYMAYARTGEAYAVWGQATPNGSKRFFRRLRASDQTWEENATPLPDELFLPSLMLASIDCMETKRLFFYEASGPSRGHLVYTFK